MVEVWSSQHRKWVAMDAELNHYFERSHVPLNMVELLEEYHADKHSRVQLVEGKQLPGAECPSLPHLKRNRLTLADTLPWFAEHITIADMRNDWMTNHYFKGHPARSESSALVYVNPWLADPVRFQNRMRPHTTSKDDFYWTLNQAEIWARPTLSNAIRLAFRTVTPNFEYYEVVVDGGVPIRSEVPEYAWGLHEGTNTLSVRSVNQFGIRGIESHIKLSVTTNSAAHRPKS